MTMELSITLPTCNYLFLNIIIFFVLKIHVNIAFISEPQNITVTLFSDTSAQLCWKKPKSGFSERYLITYTPTEINDLTKTAEIEQGREAKICHNLTQLEPRQEYWAQIRGRGKGHGSVQSRIWFRTERTGECGRVFTACKKCSVVVDLYNIISIDISS